MLHNTSLEVVNAPCQVVHIALARYAYKPLRALHILSRSLHSLGTFSPISNDAMISFSPLILIVIDLLSNVDPRVNFIRSVHLRGCGCPRSFYLETTRW